MTLPAEVVAGVRPPVGEQARSRRHGALGDDEPLALLGEGEVVAAERRARTRASASRSSSSRWRRFSLELDRAVALDDAGEETAGADGGELVRVADQDDLAVRLLDPLEHSGEDASLGHAGLVDDEHAAREADLPAACALEQPVERASRGCRSRPGASRRRRRTARRRARGRRRAAKTCATAWVAVVLPAPARPTTQTTRSGLVATARTIVSCSSESADAVGALDLGDRRSLIDGASASRPRSTSASAARSTAISSRVE